MKIFSILLIVSTFLFAQNTESNLQKTVEPPLNFSTYFSPFRFLPESYFNNELNSLDLLSHFPNDSASILIQTKMQLAMLSNQNPFDAKTNLLNPLYKNYMAGQGNRLFNQILGAVQIGAVGFLAYKHIEKYYIKKKK